MKKYLVAVVLSAVLAIGLLIYGAYAAVPVFAQDCPNGSHVVCTTVCNPLGCTTTCRTVCGY